MNAPIQFDNSYRQLPERFYQQIDPTPVSSPALIAVNRDLAAQLKIDTEWLASEQGVAILAGNEIVPGSEPIASVYAGHQFGNWNPRLGDGRAVLLGEVQDENNQRFDLQLKGSGPTLFSRGGDGRAPLGPVIREYVISEAMHALGVPSSRTLAAVTTGDTVYREEALPGAVLLRVASSHIRFGTFQYFTSIGDADAVRLLADHVIDRHYPEARDHAEPYRRLFQIVIDKTAQLVAHWQAIGFIHGVMNTDNMLICGETIDYGPCAFMDTYDPETVFSSIDVGGRYAYQNQPGIAHWNLAALAQCFTQLFSENEDEGMGIAKQELDQFPNAFYSHHRVNMANKLGLKEVSETTDELVRDLLEIMAKQSLDYTNTFTMLRRHLDGLDDLAEVLDDWSVRWISELSDKAGATQIMAGQNPVIIPRNHQVERVIQASLKGDYAPFHAFNDVLARPFNDEWLNTDWFDPPAPQEEVKQTFCGT